MRSMKRITAAFASALLLSSCASVRIVKVEGKPEPEGFPFYLPRAYVNVFEPFVINSKAFLVAGVLSPDGNYVLINNTKDQADLTELLQFNPVGDVAKKIPVNVIRQLRTPSVDTGGPQAKLEETPATPAPTLPDTPSGPPGPQPSTTSPTKPSTGLFTVTVTNTQAIFTPTLGRRFFDIIWLPNREEKYVVQATPGLGNANIGITMTQGWGLYGLDANIDNSAITQPIADMYRNTAAAMSDLVKGKIVGLGAVTGAPQGSFEIKEMARGAPVTVKVTKVWVAAPGLYPVLSKEELMGARDLPTNLKKQNLHLPVWPYTHVAFNTYEVVIIEAAKASGDSPMNLQRYYDAVTNVTPSPYAPISDQANSSSFDAGTFEKDMNGLLKNRAAPTNEYWQLSSLKMEGSKLKGKAKLIGGTNKPSELSTMEQLKAFVAGQTNMRFQAKDVELVEEK